MNKMKLPCSFNEISKDDDRRLLKCVLKIQHDKDNPNGSFFDLDDIDKAVSRSLRNTPILGSVVFDEDSEEYRLNGHDMEHEIVKTENGFDFKIRYIERIYGFIANDSPVWYEEEDGRTYLYTHGYLWRNYLGEIEDILRREDESTNISMEIEVDDCFEREDGLVQIKDYIFNGITMISLPTGMINTKLNLFSKDMSTLKSEMEELYKVYSLERGEDILEENKILDTDEVVETQEVEEEVVIEEEIVEEVISEEVVEIDIESNELELLQEKYDLAIKELDELKVTYAELEEKITGMADYESLKEFKANYDKAKYEQEVEDASKMFDLTDEEVKEFKEKALNYEISVDDLKKELAFMYVMKEKSNKSFAKSTTETIEIPVVEEQPNAKEDIYAKYLNK